MSKDQMAIDISGDMSKPARRIVVGKQSLAFQKFFPFIANNKQLINWAIALWVLIVVGVFLNKFLDNGEVLPNQPEVIEFELPQKPVIHTIETKPKIEVVVENQTSNVVETPTIQTINASENNEECKLLSDKRMHMEQVNDQAGNEENQDWKKAVSEFE
jgi:hypothetical protein